MKHAIQSPRTGVSNGARASALASALAMAVLGSVPVTRAMAQAVPAPSQAPAPALAPATAAPSANPAADATVAQPVPAAKGRGRKTVGQGMNPQAEAGDPRVDTSASGLSPAPAATGDARATAAAAAGANATAPASTAGQPKTAKQADRVDLDTTTVTGNRELPKVMYVVPWKKSDLGDLGGKPMNSLLDEVLAPVDRDEFRREVVYYQAVNSDASQKGAGDAASPPAAPKQVEK